MQRPLYLATNDGHPFPGSDIGSRQIQYVEGQRGQPFPCDLYAETSLETVPHLSYITYMKMGVIS